MGQESAGMGPESTGMRLDSAGMTLFLQEWNISNKIAYIYKCYIYLNYNLVPFIIKNLDGLETHHHVFQAPFFHVSPLPPCHTLSQL